MSNHKSNKYGVIGDPISHSRSPEIHKLFSMQSNEKIEYEKYHVKTENLERFITEFHRNDGKGLNITLPHKVTAMSFVDEVSKNALNANAINTIIFKDGKLIGDNTDGIGLVNDLEKNFNIDIESQKILILGAGGAVRGILGPLNKKNPSHIEVSNRTLENAKNLASDFSSYMPINVCELDDLKKKGSYDLVINAISFDMNHSEINLPKNVISDSTICYDLSYDSLPTKFMEWSMEYGAKKAIQGWGMLVEQAAESYYLWKNIRPDTSSILEQLEITASSQVLQR